MINATGKKSPQGRSKRLLGYGQTIFSLHIEASNEEKKLEVFS
jgi:hypothetical protein